MDAARHNINAAVCFFHLVFCSLIFFQGFQTFKKGFILSEASLGLSLFATLGRLQPVCGLVRPQSVRGLGGLNLSAAWVGFSLSAAFGGGASVCLQPCQASVCLLLGRAVCWLSQQGKE